MTFLVLLNVPYDDWKIELVTNNLENAIDKIKTTHCNCIQVWANENMINEFFFSVRYDWDTEKEYQEHFQYEIEDFVYIIENINI